MERLTLVVPCFNEASRLDSDAFEAYASRNPRLAVVFVDDGSTDQTRTLLSGLCERRPEQLRLLGLDRNRGKAEAVRRGVVEALASAPDFVGYWDADLATPLTEIPRFLAAFEGHPGRTLVMGSRVRLLGRDIRRSAVRHYAGRVFATLVSVTLGLPVYDTQCGAKVFRATDAVREAFARPFGSRWIFDVELLARLTHRDDFPRDSGEALFELPLDGWTDVAGSKLKPSDSVRAMAELVRIARRYPRSRR